MAELRSDSLFNSDLKNVKHGGKGPTARPGRPAPTFPHVQVCSVEGCPRSDSHNGFIAQASLLEHMGKVHGLTDTKSVQLQAKPKRPFVKRLKEYYRTDPLTDRSDIPVRESDLVTASEPPHVTIRDSVNPTPPVGGYVRAQPHNAKIRAYNELEDPQNRSDHPVAVLNERRDDRRQVKSVDLGSAKFNQQDSSQHGNTYGQETKKLSSAADLSCIACNELEITCDATNGSQCTECWTKNIKCQFREDTKQQISNASYSQDLLAQIARYRKERDLQKRLVSSKTLANIPSAESKDRKDMHVQQGSHRNLLVDVHRMLRDTPALGTRQLEVLEPGNGPNSTSQGRRQAPESRINEANDKSQNVQYRDALSAPRRIASWSSKPSDDEHNSEVDKGNRSAAKSALSYFDVDKKIEIDFQGNLVVNNLTSGTRYRISNGSGREIGSKATQAEAGNIAKDCCKDKTQASTYNIQVLERRENYGFANRAKGYVEDLTTESWDWWPLKPRLGPLKPDEARIQWRCAGGHLHTAEIPATDIRLLDALPKDSKIQQENHEFARQTAEKLQTITTSDSSSSSSDRPFSGDSSASQASSATSDTGSSNGTEEEQEQNDNGKSSERDPNRGKDVVVDIEPPRQLKGFVLFGVLGARRLHAAKTRLAQIDVEAFSDDDSFFDELYVQYKRLRGFFRWTFSIWQFRTCEFIFYHKANPNEIHAGQCELPSAADEDYEYCADRDPPILESLFQSNFYGCNKACMKARLDVLRIFHECHGRNYYGKCRILQLLPKRCSKWEIDNDDEKDEAWGLYAVFGVSFYKVVLYHLLILIGPLVFWGFWLSKWPRDWQNASVPFFAVVVLLSLLWLPMVHRSSDSSKEKKRKLA
ncbi:hypothetical protein ACLMJK_001458 [Lecanora helva]